jgi:hypothetical protein
MSYSLPFEQGRQQQTACLAGQPLAAVGELRHHGVETHGGVVQVLRVLVQVLEHQILCEACLWKQEGKESEPVTVLIEQALRDARLSSEGGKVTICHCVERAINCQSTVFAPSGP